MQREGSLLQQARAMHVQRRVSLISKTFLLLTWMTASLSATVSQSISNTEHVSDPFNTHPYVHRLLSSDATHKETALRGNVRLRSSQDTLSGYFRAALESLQQSDEKRLKLQNSNEDDQLYRAVKLLDNSPEPDTDELESGSIHPDPLEKSGIIYKSFIFRTSALCDTTCLTYVYYTLLLNSDTSSCRVDMGFLSIGTLNIGFIECTESSISTETVEDTIRPGLAASGNQLIYVENDRTVSTQ
eukprot:gb/GEZJ01002334.1/.p1 GENE.gb/GEZJ01002334.1/~~gb/GEZJ01002334.1/.p1  ORF type:complete len:243 (-),score=30.47 gb/GEZJ01002334.1/:2092-2820(-)